MPAIRRLHTSGHDRNVSIKELYEQRQKLRLKDVFNMIARESGFENWSALLKGGNEKLKLIFEFAIENYPSSHLNHWYPTYEQAKEHQIHYGGYLLGYRNQFVICCAEKIEILGWNPRDPLWEWIGFDAVKPLNEEAFFALCKARSNTSHSEPEEPRDEIEEDSKEGP
jgi:hypothetical protein